MIELGLKQPEQSLPSNKKRRQSKKSKVRNGEQIKISTKHPIRGNEVEQAVPKISLQTQLD